MGCANYHAKLYFNDGSIWLIRISQNGFDGVPQWLVDHLVAREYATLKFLELQKFQLPEHWGMDFEETGNDIRVSYILFEMLPGMPYYGQRVSRETVIIDVKKGTRRRCRHFG
jgi:hypothetical protein